MSKPNLSKFKSEVISIILASLFYDECSPPLPLMGKYVWNINFVPFSLQNMTYAAKVHKNGFPTPPIAAQRSQYQKIEQERNTWTSGKKGFKHKVGLKKGRKTLCCLGSDVFFVCRIRRSYSANFFCFI